MIDTPMTFFRYEVKYFLNKEQKEKLLKLMEPYMHVDMYGKTTIRNVYYDTGSYRLIRTSLERPAYKEKLRLRSYHTAKEDEPVFVELKKKYDTAVYKRRIMLPLDQAVKGIAVRKMDGDDSQIGKEIEYFTNFYENLKPAVFLCYDRTAYETYDGSDLRMTFDEQIRYRTDDMSLHAEAYGKPIVDENLTLLEIKTAGAMPLWLANALNENGIHRSSFSKYGTAYKDMMCQMN